jgi:hypothetical protein
MSTEMPPDAARQLRDHLNEALGDDHYGDGFNAGIACAPAAAPIPPGTVKCAEGLGEVSPNQAADIRKAADALDAAFRYRLTPEGSEFWSAIFDRLCDLADLAEDAAARRPKVPEPVTVRDDDGDPLDIGADSRTGTVDVDCQGLRCFTPAQAREAAAALVKMADALEAP